MSLEQTLNELIHKGEEAIPQEDGDYIGENGLLYCGKCNTPKQKEFTALGRVWKPYMLCKCRAEKRDREEAEREQQKHEQQIDYNRRMAFPKEEREQMQQWTFSNDDMQNKRITQAMQNYVDNFPELKKQGKGLLLYGECGTGKTFSACEVANALIDKGYKVLVTNFARVLNTLQGTFEKQDYIDSLNDYSLLVIDDLGIERDTSYAKEQVYNIIDSRYRAGLPMIITTNLSIDKIKKPDDMENMRIYDRILERCFPIEINGGNRRRQAIRNEYEEMKNLLGL